MRQPDLFTDPFTGPTVGEAYAASMLARTDDPGTSKEAAAKIVASGARAHDLQLAWECLREYGPCSSKELEWRSGYGDGKIRKRLSELKHLGRAKTVGKRKCSVTGFNVQIWEACET